MIRARPFLLAAYAGLMTVLCAPVWADDAETQALRKEVEELKQKVQKLEEQQAAKPESGQAASSAQPSPAPPAEQPAPQVAAPAPSRHAAPTPAPAASPAQQAAPTPTSTPAPAASATTSVPALRESWNRVAKNMSQAEILAVLGQPNKETHIDGRLVWYYYYPGIGGASVFFRNNGHVSSYQAPSVGWW